ncbi:hypothetical protein BOTCAL_1602g00010 [Botryotinia calthae]|uniref:Uncharacterized protein n=1 Tax=Botryotinia calthae TaxID=38488 RepID=A0A4Y8CD99_9HELO|nr:hypothetical protein BOTCAL_1602g00010 [Botryotinia calthae]
MDHSLPIKCSRGRPKGSIRSGRPDRLPKYSFTRPSSLLTQDELAFDSVVAGSEPAAAEPESSPPVTPPQVTIPEIKLISPIGNQSFVLSSVSPIVERALLNPVVFLLYSAPLSFAGYPSIWSPQSHAYSHRLLDTCHPESYSFRSLADIIVPGSREVIAVLPGEVEDCSFIKIKDNNNPFPLLFGDRPGPSSIKKGKRVLKCDPQSYFHPSVSPFTAPTQKGHSPSSGDSDPEDLLSLAQIQRKRTEQGSSTWKDRANSESLDETKKGLGAYDYWFRGRQKLLAIVIRTLVVPRVFAAGAVRATSV